MNEDSNKSVKHGSASFIMDASLIYSPEAELEVLARLATGGKQVDWKPAIVLAAAYLERYGAERLKRFFAEREIPLKNMFDRASLPEISAVLYGLGLIKPKVWTLLDRIWHERLDIVHPESVPYRGDYLGNKANKKYSVMIKESIRIMIILSGEGVEP